MSIIGKIVGVILGWLLLHNPLGIFVGFVLGHLWDRGAMRMRMFAPPAPDAFVAPLFALAGAIAKSDGRVSEREIAAAENLMARLRLAPALRADAIAQFKAGKQPQFELAAAIAQLRTWAHGRRDLAWLLLDMLLEVVYAEGPLAPDKLAIVRQLCAALGVPEHELAAMAALRGYAYATHGGSYERAPRPAPAGKDPYAVLGLNSGASAAEIKRAYRKLMSQYHPDKLGDVPEELKRRAGERAREINAAYETLRTQHGIT